MARLREALAADARLGFDTEFIRERTYAPVLEIVQVSAALPSGDRLIGIVDVPALNGSLGPLGDLLLDTSVLKIVHAGGQDMEILTALLGQPPAPVFDTQVAAAFAGYSLQTGYGALVQAVLGIRLSKEEGFADWSRRPLTPSMRDYAENDVRYLQDFHTKLATLLERRGRLSWAEEQTNRLLAQASEPLAPRELWRRVGGKNLLESKGLAILRELARWRDEEARRRDKPRRTVMKDEALIEIAKRAPQTAQAVLDLRGVQNVGERMAESLAAQVRLGLAVPHQERPHLESTPTLDEQGAALVELLSAVVRIRAVEEHLPPSLLASGDELRNLAGGRKSADAFTGPLFTGWRGSLIGDDLRAVLAGERAVKWDNTLHKLVFIPT